MSATKLGVTALVVGALVLFPGAARAEDEDDVPAPFAALVTGTAISFVSLTAGGLMMAEGKTTTVRNIGLLGAETGMVIAPFAAHAVVGEYRRGALFSLLPLTGEAISATLVAVHPRLVVNGELFLQYGYFVGLTANIMGGALAILDAVRVGERRPKTVGGLTFAPMFGNVTGALVSGSL